MPSNREHVLPRDHSASTRIDFRIFPLIRYPPLEQRHPQLERRLATARQYSARSGTHFLSQCCHALCPIHWDISSNGTHFSPIRINLPCSIRRIAVHVNISEHSLRSQILGQVHKFEDRNVFDRGGCCLRHVLVARLLSGCQEIHLCRFMSA